MEKNPDDKWTFYKKSEINWFKKFIAWADLHQGFFNMLGGLLTIIIILITYHFYEKQLTLATDEFTNTLKEQQNAKVKDDIEKQRDARRDTIQSRMLRFSEIQSEIAKGQLKNQQDNYNLQYQLTSAYIYLESVNYSFSDSTVLLNLNFKNTGQRPCELKTLLWAVYNPKTNDFIPRLITVNFQLGPQLGLTEGPLSVKKSLYTDKNTLYYFKLFGIDNTQNTDLTSFLYFTNINAGTTDLFKISLVTPADLYAFKTRLNQWNRKANNEKRRHAR